MVRTNAACIKLKNTTAFGSIAGEWAVIDNVPYDAIRDLEATGFPDVNEMFSYATRSGSFTKDPIEVIYRPTDADSFVDCGDSVIGTGNPGSAATSFSENSALIAPNIIGIAWRNATSNSFSLEATKVVEWTPAPHTGMRQTRPVEGDSRTRSAVVRALDRVSPSWTMPMHGSVGNAIGALAYTGTTAIRSFGSGMQPVLNAGMNAAGQAAGYAAVRGLARLAGYGAPALLL
jgi:hypothetical protein